jgi:hypothetical protein
MRLQRILGITAATALLLLTQTAAAQSQGWHEGAASAASMRDLIPRLSSGQAYSERYNFSVDLDGGGHIGVDFTISNLGIGNHRGAASVRVRLPGEERYSFSEQVRRRSWNYAQDRFMLDIANTTVESKGNDTFVIKHDGDVKLELEFKNTIPMWKPGNGEIRVGTDGYYRFTLSAPRADVTGRVFIAGQWREVRGTRSGYGDHVATNVAPYDFAKRFSRFRHYNDDVFVIWREIKLEEKHGGQTYTWVMVGHRDQIVFADPNATLREGNVRSDASTGYDVPHTLQVEGRRGQETLTLQMVGGRVEKKDILASYGRAARMVAGTVSNPFQYNVQSRYTLQLNAGARTGTTTGNSHYTIDFINP